MAERWPITSAEREWRSGLTEKEVERIMEQRRAVEEDSDPDRQEPDERRYEKWLDEIG